jgi:hypothetical protein
MSVCLYSYAARKRMRHGHLWPVWFFNIFAHYLINGAIFEEKVTEHKMCVLIFSIIFV